MNNQTDLRRNPLLGNSYTIPDVFNATQCTALIELAKTQAYKSGDAKISDQALENKDIRRSKNYFLEHNEQTDLYYQRTLAVFQKYNQLMQFHITTLEPLQILEYSENGFYNWHIDVGTEQFSTRKISLVTLLSSPTSFEGGVLEFKTTDTPFQTELSQGEAVLFPAYLLHRLNPVTKGVRYVMVTWAHGNAFS